jgi:hypothetical protein
MAASIIQRLRGSNSERRRTLLLTYWDGAFTALMIGFSESFAIVWGVKMGLSLVQIGVLSTLPILIGAFAQWIIPPLISNKNLKVGIQLAHLVQITGLGLLLSLKGNDEIYFQLLIALTFYWVGGMVTGPLWLDWISGWLPHGKFSRFLGKRNSFVAAITLFSFLSAAVLVGGFEREFNPDRFFIIFAGGFTARVVSWIVIWFHSSPPLRKNPTLAIGIQKLSERSRKPVYAIICFTVLFKFVVNIASPFFLPYMFEELKFDLATYVLITAIPFLGRTLYVAKWGEAARQIKPFVGLQIACFGIAANAFFWSLAARPAFLGFVEFLSGVMWGGFDLFVVLIVQNYWPGSARKILGFHLALMSLASLGGAAVGAHILKVNGGDYIALFQTSAGYRALVALGFFLVLRRLKETRVSLKVYGDFMATVISIRPSMANIGRIIPLRRK